jgi:predicted MPP superfamily phosphohydrolase
MVSLSIAIVITGIINFKTIRTARYSIEIPQKATGMDQLRIAYIADFHLQPKTSVRYVKKVVNRINAIQPDLMLFGGDIVEGDGDEGKLARFEKLLGQVKSKYGSYGVIGNHEIYGGKDVDQFFRDAEIKLLKDTTVVIGSAINLAGRLDQHIKDRKPPEEILRQANDSLPVILLDHRPTRIQEISQTRADIQLSGHTHNGQLFPFNLITQSIYPISWGYEVINNTHFIVTSGIRLWGPPVRTAGRSEIVVVDLTFR